jgi:hypothetical protein
MYRIGHDGKISSLFKTWSEVKHVITHPFITLKILSCKKIRKKKYTTNLEL